MFVQEVNSFRFEFEEHEKEIIDAATDLLNQTIEILDRKNCTSVGYFNMDIDDEDEIEISRLKEAVDVLGRIRNAKRISYAKEVYYAKEIY